MSFQSSFVLFFCFPQASESVVWRDGYIPYQFGSKICLWSSCGLQPPPKLSRVVLLMFWRRFVLSQSINSDSALTCVLIFPQLKTWLKACGRRFKVSLGSFSISFVGWGCAESCALCTESLSVFQSVFWEVMHICKSDEFKVNSVCHSQNWCFVPS